MADCKQFFPWTADSTEITADQTSWTVDGGWYGECTPFLLYAADIEKRIDWIATQWRESPNLISMMRNYMDEIGQALAAVRAIPYAFDLDTATGHQLTLIGKHLGFPRCQCVCADPPAFGYSCADPPSTSYPLVGGYCDDYGYYRCGETIVGEICIYDDELYRRMLKVRRYQYLGMTDFDSIQMAAKEMFGDKAFIVDRPVHRDVVFVPMRYLTQQEENAIQIIFRALPVPLGIRPMVHRGPLSIIGYGTGWVGYCEPEPEDEPCGYINYCDPDFCYGNDLRWDDTGEWDDAESWQDSGLVDESLNPRPGDQYIDRFTYSCALTASTGYCYRTEGISTYLCPEDPRPYECAA